MRNTYDPKTRREVRKNAIQAKRDWNAVVRQATKGMAQVTR